jgi:hypothetical protein
MTRGGVTADFRSFPYEPLRSAVVSSTLDQDVENETILIDGAPEPVLFARDRDDDLIHMPFIAASRRALADLIGERLRGRGQAATPCHIVRSRSWSGCPPEDFNPPRLPRATWSSPRRVRRGVFELT